MTADELVAIAAEYMDGPTTPEMRQPETTAQALRMLLEMMLSQFDYQTGIAHGPSIIARGIASIIWRLEDEP